MLQCADKHGHDFGIRVGTTVRLPLLLGEQERYPYTWEVVAFGGEGYRHCAVIERRHDKLQTQIALHWIDAYRNGFEKQ